jgi:hypothetical protein
MSNDLELRVIKRQQVELAEEMLSVSALSERWHCHSNTVLAAIKRYRESGGARGLLSVGAGRRLRVPARAANRYAASDDFLRA